MRLIDADALIPLIKMGECNMYDEYCQGRNGGIEFAVEQVKQMPTVEERKKGEWIDGSDERFVKCSKYGMETTRNELRGIALFGKEEPNYCPNCGADMRGGQNG